MQKIDYKMKSILIIQPWISYRGAESVSIEEAKAYIRKGVKASILCAYVDYKRIKKFDWSLDYITAPAWLPKFLSIPFIFILLLIHGSKYEVINPHNFPTLWITVLANFFLHKKIIWRVHNFPQVWFKNKLINLFWKKVTFPIDNWAAHKAHKIWVVSEKVQGQVKSFYGLSSKVVYPIIDKKFFSKKRHVTKDPNLVLIPAKITLAKSFDLALSVIKNVNRLRPKTKWAIAGEGKLNEVPKNTEVLGWQSKENMATLYQQAKLIFLPSYWGEGFNLVVLEGLASGTKSLVIKESGVDIYLKNNNLGIVCNPDVDEIVKAIIKFMK